MRKKFDDIYYNFMNGNLTDFKTQVLKLSKVQLMQFIQYIFGYYPKDAHAIINFLAK